MSEVSINSFQSRVRCVNCDRCLFVLPDKESVVCHRCEGGWSIRSLSYIHRKRIGREIDRKKKKIQEQIQFKERQEKQYMNMNIDSLSLFDFE